VAQETPDALKVSSWSELLEAPYQGSWNPQIARYRLNLAFRGTAQAHYSFETSLSRLVAGRSYDLEAHILRAFRKYAYMLVGVSAAMFVLLGEVMMTRYAGDTRGVQVDSTRVLSVVTTGISFLGAGTIFISGGYTVQGLTTAASLLATAVGIAVGMERYVLAVGTTLLNLSCCGCWRAQLEPPQHPRRPSRSTGPPKARTASEPRQGKSPRCGDFFGQTRSGQDFTRVRLFGAALFPALGHPLAAFLAHIVLSLTTLIAIAVATPAVRVTASFGPVFLGQVGTPSAFFLLCHSFLLYFTGHPVLTFSPADLEP
jgi:hypothetical protein